MTDLEKRVPDDLAVVREIETHLVWSKIYRIDSSHTETIIEDMTTEAGRTRRSIALSEHVFSKIPGAVVIAGSLVAILVAVVLNAPTAAYVAIAAAVGGTIGMEVVRALKGKSKP